jgi:hypothetical protein
VEHIRLTREQEAELKVDSIGEKLKLVMNRLPPRGVTLAEIRDLIGEEGLLMLSAFLTLIFLVPVSVPGVSTVFGAAILLIGISRLFSRNLWLPKKFESRVVATDTLHNALEKGLHWFARLERVSRPHRINWLTADGPMSVLNNLGLILGAVLLMAPFGLIPFSNTFPAVALLLLSIGLLQRDGVCVLLGHLANVITIFYFATLIGGGGMAIHRIIQYLSGTTPTP